MTPFELAVATVQKWLHNEVRRERREVKCPVCGKRHALRKRALNAGMARVMVYFYSHNKSNRRALTAWIDTGKRREPVPPLSEEFKQELRDNQLDFAKLRYWGLMEKKQVKDDPGDPAERIAGFWRLTDKGTAFVEGRVKVPEFVREDCGKVVYRAKKRVGIRQALDTPFDLWDVLFG